MKNQIFNLIIGVVLGAIIGFSETNIIVGVILVFGGTLIATDE